MVKILLRAFKSFIAKYSIVCTFIQTIHFQYICNFSYANHFIINCLKSIKTNQYAFSYKLFYQFKSFCNHSNTLELEREKWRTNSKMKTKEEVEEQTKKLVALDSNPRNLDQFGLSSSSTPIPIQLTIILLVEYSRSSIQVYFLPDSPLPYILHFFRKSLTFVLGNVIPHF